MIGDVDDLLDDDDIPMSKSDHSMNSGRGEDTGAEAKMGSSGAGGGGRNRVQELIQTNIIVNKKSQKHKQIRFQHAPGQKDGVKMKVEIESKCKLAKSPHFQIQLTGTVFASVK